MKNILATVLALALVLSCVPAALAAEPDAPLTRGEALEMLLHAADDYNPGVEKSDILKGYPDGSLREEEGVTRLQALLMLERAFGGLPEATGAYALAAYDASNFTDIPDWAEVELSNVLQSGIAVGTSDTKLDSDALVTREQMELFIRRAYALEGSNLKDDFYATVNREYLTTTGLLPGFPIRDYGYEMTVQVNADVAAMIQEIAQSGGSTGREKKIAAMYNNFLDWDSRNEAGLTPIQPYLDAIDTAADVEALMEVNTLLVKEQAETFMIAFGIAADAEDSTAAVLEMELYKPILGQSGYANASDAQKNSYLTYAATLLELSGVETEEARRQAELCWDTESDLAAVMLDAQESQDTYINRTYYTMARLQELFPTADLPELLAAENIEENEKILVRDTRLAETLGALFQNENLDTVKALYRFALLKKCAGRLSQDFFDAVLVFNETYYGRSATDAATAAQLVQQNLEDYLGEAYVARYASDEVKTDVERMLREMIAAYRERIAQLDWMSDTTREGAYRKLDTMKLHVGWPDEWDDSMDSVPILSADEGGSCYQNWVAINQMKMAHMADTMSGSIEKDTWVFSPYTVNAMYSPLSNTIEVPIAFLQEPLYDVDATYEERLGGIGYILAHEITHAFDSNGANYDENGNVKDWWTDADRAVFEELCRQAAAFYDGHEAAPGIPCNGTLNLSENIADMGAIACLTYIVSQQENPDYETLYRTASRTWRSVATRDYLGIFALSNIHAPDSVRGQLPLQTCGQFYETFGITEGDGMWIPPEERVAIW